MGDDEPTLGDTRCYIGEAGVVGEWLRHHHRDKDFWDRVVVITSKDTNLTKSHGRYLESRLISLATQAARVTLENGTTHTSQRYPKPTRPTWTTSWSKLQIVLPVLGANAIRIRPRHSVPASSAAATESPVFRLAHTRLGADARAQEIDGEFTMLTGSMVVSTWHGVGKADSTLKAYASYRAQHERLVSDGAIVVEARGAGSPAIFCSPRRPPPAR